MKKIEVGSEEYEHIKDKIRGGEITKRLNRYAKNVGSENFMIYYIPNGLFFPEFYNGLTDCEKYFRKINSYKGGRLQAIIMRTAFGPSFDYKIIENGGKELFITNTFSDYLLPKIFPEHNTRLNTDNTNIPMYQ